jgi:hypothetical protein
VKKGRQDALMQRLQKLEELENRPAGRPIDAEAELAKDTAEDLASAAEFLLTYLPEGTQLLIREATTTMGNPLWQTLLGYVMRCADRQELFSPVILSMWESGLRPNGPRPCLTCGQDFRSEFPEARYCCTPCHFQKLEQFGHAADCAIGVEVAS